MKQLNSKTVSFTVSFPWGNMISSEIKSPPSSLPPCHPSTHPVNIFEHLLCARICANFGYNSLRRFVFQVFSYPSLALIHYRDFKSVILKR